MYVETRSYSEYLRWYNSIAAWARLQPKTYMEWAHMWADAE